MIWFVATILIMAIGFAIFENADQDPGPGPQRRIAEFFLHEAGQIYGGEGSAGLRHYLQRIESSYGGKAFLVDDSGRDLASGVDRAEFIRAAQEAKLPWFSKDGVSFNHVKSGDGHWFFLQTVRANRGGLSPFQRILVARYTFFEELAAPQRLWLMAGVLAICYILARSLTAPLRSLQSVVEHFGRGDFTARSHSHRRDEVGELARAFDGMARQIQLLLDRQRDLLREISHELRSPLTRLNLALDLARSGLIDFKRSIESRESRLG